MILTAIGLATASAFAGAALYINWCEHPARLSLNDAALLRQWKESYARGFEMQASLALIAGALGLAAYYFEQSFAAMLGGLLLLANWPYTLLAIIPTNRRLVATPNEEAGADTRALLVKWGKLHALRTLLSIAGVAAFVTAIAMGGGGLNARA